jgi:small conductance mechanosensitive channel
MEIPNIGLVVDWANRNLLSIALGFAAAIVTIFIGRWIARKLTAFSTRRMERAHLDPLVVRFTSTLIYFGLLGAVIIAALNEAGIHTNSLTAIFAAAGLAISLALKDSLSSLASGVMILLFCPYNINDSVEAAGMSGAVEEVQIFSTIFRTPDNTRVIVPNSEVIKSNIRNHSAYDTRRIDLPVSVGYRQNIGELRALLLDVMASHPQVLHEPATAVEVTELTEACVKVMARCWAKQADYAPVRSMLLEQMKEQLTVAGVEIINPQRLASVADSATSDNTHTPQARLPYAVAQSASPGGQGAA